MRRFVLPLVAFVLAGSVWLGCEDPGTDPQFMHIIGNTLVSPRTQCMIRAGATEYRLAGYMDVAVTNTYWFYPQVANQLEMSDNYTQLGGEQLRLNNNNITIHGASIQYDWDPTDPLVGGIDWIGYEGFMHASGAARPGEIAPVAVPIIPWDLGNVLKERMTVAGGNAPVPLGQAGTQINVRIVVEGVLADGTPVQSNEFWYPLTICNGCLIYFPPLVDPRLLLENITVPCAPGQDDGVDTRLCYAYATGRPGNDESLNVARDQCRWQHILLGVEPPDSTFYFNAYRQYFPEGSQACGLNGLNCR